MPARCCRRIIVGRCAIPVSFSLMPAFATGRNRSIRIPSLPRGSLRPTCCGVTRPPWVSTAGWATASATMFVAPAVRNGSNGEQPTGLATNCSPASVSPSADRSASPGAISDATTVWSHLMAGIRDSTLDFKFSKLGIHLTQVTPRCSVGPGGGLPARPTRIRVSLCERGGLPRLSVRLALARGFPLSKVWA